MKFIFRITVIPPPSCAFTSRMSLSETVNFAVMSSYFQYMYSHSSLTNSIWDGISESWSENSHHSILAMRAGLADLS